MQKTVVRPQNGSTQSCVNTGCAHTIGQWDLLERVVAPMLQRENLIHQVQAVQNKKIPISSSQAVQKEKIPISSSSSSTYLFVLIALPSANAQRVVRVLADAKKLT